jgi:cytochrome d ubiquinol oxidase subunit I
MDAVLLARIQFGFTAGFHFLFPPTTLGLSLVIVVLESLYLKTRAESYKALSAFLIKVLSVVFVMGVATGIVLEFAFGNNWSQYSRVVGDIFGAPLAAEGIFSFFLESVFLGILVFGRRKVSERAYWWSAFLVFFASHLSGLWIIIANSWMQTPAGFKLVEGKAVLTNFFQAALNHSTMVRYIHVVLGGWITGSMAAAAIASWFLIKGRHREKAVLLLKTALVIFIVSSVLQLFSGHGHSVQVAETQPEKMAAFEALWETQEGAPMALFGLPDGKREKTRLLVEIPRFLSFLIHFDFDAEVKGLDAFPKEERPPVFLSFTAYHIMILLGMLFLLMAFSGIFLMAKKKLGGARWYHRILLFGLPLPYLANEFGWIAAEVGRQPWAVYRVLKTADAASVVVPAWQILLTLILFAAVYTLIAAVGLSVLFRMVRKGPDEEGPGGAEGGE